MTLGLAGSLLGVGAGAAGDCRRFRYALDRPRRRCWRTCEYGVTWSAAAQGIGIGVLVSLLFSVVPLLQVRLVKPSLLLRDETASRRPRLDADRRRWCWCRRRWSR